MIKGRYLITPLLISPLPIPAAGVGVSMSVWLLLASPLLCPCPIPAQFSLGHSGGSIHNIIMSRQVVEITLNRCRDNRGSDRLNTLHCRQGTKSWGLRLVGGQDVGTLLKVEKVIRCIYNLHPDPARAGPNSQLGRHSNLLLSESKKS